MARRLIGARRRAGWAALLLAVLLLHAAATRWVADSIAGWGESARAPERLAVTFVREVRPAAPPPAATPASPATNRPAGRAPRKPRPKPALPPVAAASQPEPAPADVAASAPEPAFAASQPEPAAPDVAASAAEPAFAAASQPKPPALPAPPEAPLAGADAASAPPAVDWPAQWPASTRLHYSLTGWFRGPLHGQASVEWLRTGTHYQVHLDVTVGPSFAPYMSRRMSSDGELTASGLAPRRYDELTRVGFKSPRQATIRFERDAVLLPNGRRRERWPGVQDAASQFVHLSWLFTTEPHRLVPGKTIEVPLALPRSIDRWAYDVVAADDLSTPFATLPVVHIKPRRTARPGGDLVFEAWFAPTLLYLPVRLRIHQDAETWLDLRIDRPPLQADACNPAAPCADPERANDRYVAPPYELGN